MYKPIKQLIYFLIGLSYGQQVKLAGANKDLLTKALEMQSAGEQSIW